MAEADTEINLPVDITKLPVVDADRIHNIFKELETMDVRLDADPLQYGPKRLNKKIERTRTLLSRCERIFLQVSHDLQVYKGVHRGAQLDFDLLMQELLANDPEVRAGRNVRDRDALATMKLRKEREHVMSMEVAIQDLEMVMKVIKAKRADLRDIQGRIRDQMKLCHEEIGLGARWGSKPPPGTKTPDLDAAPVTDKNMLERFDELVGGDDSPVDLGAEDVEEWTEPADEPTPEEPLADPDVSDEDVDDLLKEVSTSEEEDTDEDSVDKSVAESEAFLAEAAAEMDDEEDEDEEEEEADDESSDTSDTSDTSDDDGEETDSEDSVEDAKDDTTPDLFADDEDSETEDPDKVMKAVTSDEEVDDLFNQLDADPKDSEKAPSNVVEEDIDDIIGMFAN